MYLVYEDPIYREVVFAYFVQTRQWQTLGSPNRRQRSFLDLDPPPF
jgi:hypothetical protein